MFDRSGFRSIYLSDPDGHIVEIATRRTAPEPEPEPAAPEPAEPAGEAAGPREGPGAPPLS